MLPPSPGPGPSPQPEYVSRGGLKLEHALRTFNLDPSGLLCADLGCSTGGFTDCLLRAGAAHVFAVDTAYGQFAWKLRNDPRITLWERTNALHAPPPPGGVDLVVVDLGWTPQRLLIPKALLWLRPGGRIITLIKPHYEQAREATQKSVILADEEASRIAHAVVDAMPGLGARVLGVTQSPIRGGEKKGRGTGNLEWLALLAPLNAPTPPPPPAPDQPAPAPHSQSPRAS